MKFAFIVAVLLLLSPIFFADTVGNQLAAFSRTLDATITVPNGVLIQSPQTIAVAITVRNPYSTPMPLYVIRQGANGWEMVRLLGTLTPDSATPIELDVDVHYRKMSATSTRYAVVARAEDGQLYGKYFDIYEDWGAYEQAIQEGVSSAAITVVPIIAVLLAVLMAVVFKVAYKSKSPGLDAGEYTMASVVFPETQGRPFEEKAADFIMHPLVLLLELACVAIMVFMMYTTIAQAGGPEQSGQLVVISGIGSFFVPFIYFAAAWYFEKREERKPLRFFGGIFLWGMFAAFCSLLISSWLVGALQDPSLVAYSSVIAIILIAPIVEEVMKGIGVLLMSGHHEYNDTLTGLLIGFTCGVGFSFIENWFYFSSKTNPFDVGLATWGMLVLYRSFFNSLAHGCFTGIISAPIGYLRSIPRLRRFARFVFVPAVFLAIAVHSVFNLSALADGYAVQNHEVPFYIFNPLLIILLAAFFFLLLVLATIDEKKRKLEEHPPQEPAPPQNEKVFMKKEKDTRMGRRKGQVSTELLIIIGILLLLLVPLLFYGYNRANIAKEDIGIQKAEFAAERMARLSDSVGYMGGASEIVDQVELPDYVSNITIGSNRHDIVISMDSTTGRKQIVKSSAFNLTSSGFEKIGGAGDYWMDIKALSNDPGNAQVMITVQ